MKTSYPDYYKEFHCTADKCEATCCAGWQIVVDEEALKRYKKVKGDFAGRIKEGVDFKEGVFYQKSGKRCAFLNDNNLCDMYTALGEEAFCDTCARYPRHIEEFENVREYTLSVSCPEAARILLSKKDKAVFYCEEAETEDEEFEDFDPMLYEKLVEARKEMLKLIQNRELPYEARALAVWEFAEEFQEKMDAGELFADEHLYDRLHGILGEQMDSESREGVTAFCTQNMYPLPETSYEETKALFSLLHHLEFLADDWEDYLKETEKILYGTREVRSAENIEIKQQKIREIVSEDNAAKLFEERKCHFAKWKREQFSDWAIMKEQLLVYFIYTYFCGSIYDEYVASKVKMAVCSVFFIEEMARACYLKNGGTFSDKELVRIVYRYSRELEHSDENLILMDKMMEEI